MGLEAAIWRPTPSQRSYVLRRHAEVAVPVAMACHHDNLHLIRDVAQDAGDGFETVGVGVRERAMASRTSTLSTLSRRGDRQHFVG